jgi:TBC1 domain family protein 5
MMEANDSLRELQEIFLDGVFNLRSLNYIREKAWNGKIHNEFLRAIYWRCLLGLIPFDTSMAAMANELAQQQLIYKLIKEEAYPRVDAVTSDPLSGLCNESNQNDEWNNFYKDHELKNFIKGDLDRLYMTGIDDEYFQQKLQRDIVLNILFVWSVHNRNISYRQGMHELVGPILYSIDIERQTFDRLKREGKLPAMHALYDAFSVETMEAHCYFIYNKLMNDMTILYDPTPSSTITFNDNVSPVVHFCNNIQDVQLKLIDPKLCKHLQNCTIQAQLYGMRWTRLLFGREFPLTHNECYRIWDFIFASYDDSAHVIHNDTDRLSSPILQAIGYFAVALLIKVKSSISF